ncbi:MAG: hypothetical protein QOH21_202 [Acidobacteriota bacterium]|nr:hypothetical protein [Acidobacteriota bacterium]
MRRLLVRGALLFASCVLPLAARGADFSWVRPAMTDPDPASRQAALKRLAAFGTEASDYGDDVAARLTDADPDTRYWAADTLTAIAPCTATVMQALGVATADRSRSVRARALDALAVCTWKAAPQSPAIVKAIGDGEASVMHSAMTAAGEVGRAAVKALPQLIAAAGSVDPSTRQYAVVSIGQIIGSEGDEDDPPLPADEIPKAVVALIAAASDSQTGVRNSASRAFAAAGHDVLLDTRVGAALLRLSRDPDEDVRRNAVPALAKMAKASSGEDGSPATAEMAWGRLSEMLSDETLSVRLDVADNLSDEHASEEVVPALEVALHDVSPAVREKAAEALAKLHEAADADTVAALSEAVKDPVSAVRLAALKAIAALGGAFPLTDTTPALIAVAGSADARTRLAVAETLGQLLKGWASTPPESEDSEKDHSDAAAVGALYHLLAEPSPAIRLAALESIQSAAPVAQADFDVLVATLADPDGHVRAESLQTIGAYGPDAAPILPDIIRLTRDTNKSVRFSAVETLRYVTHDDPEAMKALMAALEDSSTDVRREAARGLGWYGKLAESAIPALVTGSRNPKNPADEFGIALGRIGPAGVEAVKNVLAETPEPPPRPKPRSIMEALTRPSTEYEQLQRAAKAAEEHARTVRFDAVDAAGRPASIEVSEREALVLVASWCHFSDDWRRTVMSSTLKPFLKGFRIHMIFENSEWPTVEKRAREEGAEKNLDEETVARWVAERKKESGDPRIYDPHFLQPELGDPYFLPKETDDRSFPTYFDVKDGKFISSPDRWIKNLPIPDQVLKLAQQRAGISVDD